MGQWTYAGFEAKNLDYYKAAIQQVFIDAFGDDFLLDPQLPQGVLIQELAELFYAADMDGVEAFSRLNLNTATGVYLDLIGSMRGITRSPGAPQTLTVALTINPTNFTPFSIPAGQVFTATNGDMFKLDETVTISSTQNQVIYPSYTEDGNSQVSVGDKMSTDGYSQITDLEITQILSGTETESDMDYRNRLISEYPVAGSTVQFIANLILESPLVRAVGFNYNDTSETTGGLGPYCTEWMAVPETGADLTLFKNKVASIILNNKMPGAPTDGNTTVQVEDVFGTTKTVKFTIPTEVQIEILCTVTTPEETGRLDLSRKATIQKAIADYVKTLSIGDNVSYSRCVAPLAADPGFDIATFVIKDKNGATTISNGNYPIGPREYATLDQNDIKIEV